MKLRYVDMYEIYETKQKLTKPIQIYLTESDRDMLKILSKKTGVSLSDIVRDAIKEHVLDKFSD